jgi:16S rRNA (cytidine1402-2'-O)-methyltransferase
MAGILYVVSTPIGNPEDLTFRALRVLREVQWIASEDPRQTRQLLNHYGLATPLTTYHHLNTEEKTSLLTTRLLAGESVALVSDAGTPAIFDPGYFLISQAVASDIQVVPIPGPCAVLAAIAASGIQTDAFIVHGWFPERPEPKRRFLEALREERRTLILLVQSGRLRRILESLSPVLGARRIAVAKNLTMPDEEFLRGTAAELLQHARRRSVQGEVTLVIQGAGRKTSRRG